MPIIFISYRRDDSIDAAGRIYDRLADRFGRESVFMDVDTIPFGIDFRRYLQDAIARCDLLLAVIGHHWQEARYCEGPSEGRRRLDDPCDFVRIEIQTALERGIPVIPVLVGRATMPLEVELPDGLKELAYRNAAEVRPGRDFHDHVARLIRGIESLERTIHLAVPGELFARPLAQPEAKWVKVCQTPATVNPRPDEVYHLAVARDVGDDELAGLVQWRGSVSIVSLGLDDCWKVTPAGLSHLKGLTSLQSLRLSDCGGASDAGLANLKALTSLEQLYLNHCWRVTDTGLSHLNGMSSLRSLYVGWHSPYLTRDGIIYLKSFLPMCNIEGFYDNYMISKDETVINYINERRKLAEQLAEQKLRESRKEP